MGGGVSARALQAQNAEPASWAAAGSQQAGSTAETAKNLMVRCRDPSLVTRRKWGRPVNPLLMKYPREIPRWLLAVAEVELLTRSEW